MLFGIYTLHLSGATVYLCCSLQVNSGTKEMKWEDSLEMNTDVLYVVSGEPVIFYFIIFSSYLGGSKIFGS